MSEEFKFGTWYPIKSAEDGENVILWCRPSQIPEYPYEWTKGRINHLLGHWAAVAGGWYPVTATHWMPPPPVTPE